MRPLPQFHAAGKKRPGAEPGHLPHRRPLEVIDSCAVVPLTSFPADALSLVYMTHADSLSIQAIETFSAFVRGWSATFLEK